MRLQGVGKRYGDGAWILSDVDLDLRAGDVVAVAGANGAGKSTLLRVLVGLSRPTVGDVTGRPTAVGYVPDRFPPHDRMSARAYLTHMGRIRGLRGRQARRRADELLDRLALAGGADTALRRLSRGNSQKVALAQALLVQPELLVLDEPWSGLDAEAHGTLGEIITELGRDGSRVVFTDHREAVTAAHAHRTYRIDAGRLTEAVTAAPARVELRPTGDDPVALADLPGVTGTQERDGTVTMLVDAEHCDAVLRAALDGGWSVMAVRRSAGVLR
ncbi:MAG TPA: ABC transporter ATP-binding protein [Pseudonocardiaceae bacterium]|nr:ABC transporter ATP-binding protein [Pseudonocardiaceae bacterium]